MRGQDGTTFRSSLLWCRGRCPTGCNTRCQACCSGVTRVRATRARAMPCDLEALTLSVGLHSGRWLVTIPPRGDAAVVLRPGAPSDLSVRSVGDRNVLHACASAHRSLTDSYTAVLVERCRDEAHRELASSKARMRQALEKYVRMWCGEEVIPRSQSHPRLCLIQVLGRQPQLRVLRCRARHYVRQERA